MAADEKLVRELVALGMSYRLAMKLADPVDDTINAAAVTNPAAMTAPASMGAAYSETNVNALRADVNALRTTVQSLLTSLRNAGVIAP